MSSNRIIYKVNQAYPWNVVNIQNNQPAPFNDQPPIQVRKNAYKNNWYIERKVYGSNSSKAGKVFWQFIKDPGNVSHLDNTSGPTPATQFGSTPKIKTPAAFSNPAPKAPEKIKKTVSKVIKKKVRTLSGRNFETEKNYSKKSILDLLVPENMPTKVPVYGDDDESTIKFIHESYAYKPKFMKLSQTKWTLLVRAALRGENTLISGDKGEGKTMTAIALANALGRPLFKINFGHMQDAQTALIGKTHFDVSKGTVFSKSYFVEAITTPNAIVLLDELSRSSDDAMNIMFPVLDMNQRYLRLNDEVDSPIVEIAEGVCFVATANIGHEYTGTRQLDAALKDRFSTKIEVDHLDTSTRKQIIMEAFPSLSSEISEKVARLANDINSKVYSDSSEISIPVSTRMCLACAKLIHDGFTPMQAIESTVYPEYSEDGGNQSERTFIKQIVQGLDFERIEKIYNSQEYETKEVEEIVNEDIWVTV